MSTSLLDICQQIQAKGTKPSVSLLRAKAPFKVGIADAIAAIKSFQAGDSEVVLAESKVPQDPQIRISELEDRVSELETAMVNIQERFNKLDAN